jgi:hypothetical protein
LAFSEIHLCGASNFQVTRGTLRDYRRLDERLFRDQAGRAAPATDVLNETLERLHLLLEDLAVAWHADRQGLGRVINGLWVAAVPQREPPR